MIREIENSRQRTVTFARRRAGLIKKAHELSILCGVKVAIVIFDTKNASHVYASADTPEELFARYLNKQFLTNESRKRKDGMDGTGDGGNGGGTYGFDGSGSFIRRRLAVVNEYKVTSDGPNSRNLHVKYTKQYHNPAAAAAIKRLSVASNASSTTTLDPNHQPLSLDNMQPAILSSLNMPLAGTPMGGPLPARSASLFRPYSAYPPSFARMPPYDAVFGDAVRALGATPMGVGLEAMDGLGLATRDLSSLSLLSGASSSYMAISAPAADTAAPAMTSVAAMLGVIDTGAKHLSTTPLSIVSGTGMRSAQESMSPLAIRRSASDANSGHPAKRQRVQPGPAQTAACVDSAAAAGSGDALDYGLNQALVEDLLANANVADLLRTSWPQTPANGCAEPLPHAESDCSASSHTQVASADDGDSCIDDDEYADDDDEDDEDDDDDDDDEDDDDDGTTGDGDEGSEETCSADDMADGPPNSASRHAAPKGPAATAADVEQHMCLVQAAAMYGSGSGLDANQNLLHTLQSMEMASAQLFPAYVADIGAPPPPPDSYSGMTMSHATVRPATGQSHTYPSDLLLAAQNGKVF
ncbi:hypothetical protein H4R19_001473 [Coemansia spiralis]|nr:hypothetical protein H4R19_001473 [Coemansia spiralis]